MSIEEDLRDWSAKVLEVPNPILGGIPACPFARKAWLDDRVSVVECEDIFKQTIIECGNFDPLNKGLVICASYNLPDAEDMNDWVMSMNALAAKADLHLMVFHPDYGAEEAGLDFLYDHNWESKIEHLYCMIFIQSLSEVDDASLILENQGYYDVYPEDEYNELVLERRNRRYGYETSCYEA